MILSGRTAALGVLVMFSAVGLAACPVTAGSMSRGMHLPHRGVCVSTPGDNDTGNGDAPTASVPVEDTEQFFHAFVSNHLPPDSDPFKDRPEGQPLPTVWDAKKIVYFTVMPDAQSTGVVPSNGGAFYYSLWTQNLTAFGGWKADHADGGWHPRDTQPVQIRRGIEGLGQHEAPLGFGSPVTVVDFSAVDYVLYLHGTKTCPPNVFDKDNCRFALTTHLLPADAKALSNHVQVVIGVRPRSYADSYFGMIRQHDATQEARSQSTEYRASIEADFEKVLLLDTSSGQTVAEWDMMPDSKLHEVPHLLSTKRQPETTQSDHVAQEFSSNILIPMPRQ